MDVIANNIANANTTKALTEKFSNVRLCCWVKDSMPGRDFKGVAVRQLTRDSAPGRLVYEPGHPDADENGYVQYSNEHSGGNG